MSRTSHTLFKRQPEVESAPLEDECILYHPGENRFLRLNRTASFVWSRLESPASAETIAGDLVGRFKGVERPDAIRDIAAVLDQMVSMSVAEAHKAGPESEPAPGGTR